MPGLRSSQLVAVMLVSFGLSGCGPLVAQTVPDVSLKVRPGRDVWPAIVTAFQQKGTQLSELDLYTNKFRTGYFVFNDFTVATRAKYSAQVGADSLLSVNLTDIYMSNGNGWEENATLIGVHPANMTNSVKLIASTVYENDSLYEFHKNRLLTDFNFNYMVMKNMTEVARKAWLNSLEGRFFHWTGSLQDLKENDPNSRYKRKYVALFAFSTDNRVWEIATRIYVRLYTSNPDYVKAVCARD